MADFFDPTIGMAPPAPKQKEPDYFDPTFKAPQGYQPPSPEVVGVPQPKPKYEANIPVITEAKGMPWKVAAGLLASSSPEQAKDILKANIPGAKIEKDIYGTDVVNIPEQGRFYIDRPGLDWQDILHTAAQGVAYIGGATGATAPFKSLIGRAVGAGLGAGATSAGLDVAAMGAGSEQGVDLPRAGQIAAGGALFELGTPVMSAIVRKLFSGGRLPSVQAARQSLQEAGFNPQELTDEAVNAFIKEARTAVSPQAAGTFAEAQTLPVKVPLTRGQVSGRAQEQMFEDLALKGAYGEAPETIMRGATQRTEEALRANIPEIQQQIAGGVSRVSAPGEGIARAQSRLTGEAEALSEAIRGAYETAETTVSQISPQGIKPFVSNMQKEVGRIMRNAPAVKGEIDDLGSLAKVRKPITVNELFDWRRGMSELRANAPNATERAAAGKAVRAFDDSIEETIKGYIQTGDDAAAAAWFDAIAKRREYGKLFEGKEGASKIISMLVKEGEGGLTVDPQVASRMVFGQRGSKLLTDPNTPRILGGLKQRLGANSDEWLAIKEEAFMHLMQRSAGAYQGGVQGFSGVGIKKAIDQMKRENPRAWETLFNDSERKLISQFANVAARATNPVKGGANFSNTSVGLSRIVQSLGDAVFLGPKGKALLSRIFPTAYEGLQMGPAAAAARGGIPRRQIPSGIMGGIGATATTERERYQ